VKDGIVYINGVAAPQTDAGTFEEIKEPQGSQRGTPRCVNDPVGRGGICIKERYIETMPNGASHHVLNIANSPADNTPLYSVPAGHYFFMGDNRDNSQDSRFAVSSGGVGMLPAEYLIGRADRIMFSSAGRSLFFFWTWRGDRFFKAVE
jgi:signal peptidase I